MNDRPTNHQTDMRAHGKVSFMQKISFKDVEKRQKKRLLLDYLSDNLKHHNWWAYRYFFCEFLALINIIGQFKTISLEFCFSFLNWVALIIPRFKTIIPSTL